MSDINGGGKDLAETTILQFPGIRTLMRNDDCLQQCGGPDIPLGKTCEYYPKFRQSNPSQNWVPSPSPPAAIGLKSGTALQLAAGTPFKQEYLKARLKDGRSERTHLHSSSLLLMMDCNMPHLRGM